MNRNGVRDFKSKLEKLDRTSASLADSVPILLGIIWNNLHEEERAEAGSLLILRLQELGEPQLALQVQANLQERLGLGNCVNGLELGILYEVLEILNVTPQDRAPVAVEFHAQLQRVREMTIQVFLGDVSLETLTSAILQESEIVQSLQYSDEVKNAIRETVKKLGFFQPLGQLVQQIIYLTEGSANYDPVVTDNYLNAVETLLPGAPPELQAIFRQWKAFFQVWKGNAYEFALIAKQIDHRHLERWHFYAVPTLAYYSRALTELLEEWDNEIVKNGEGRRLIQLRGLIAQQLGKRNKAIELFSVDYESRHGDDDFISALNLAQAYLDDRQASKAWEVMFDAFAKQINRFRRAAHAPAREQHRLHIMRGAHILCYAVIQRLAYANRLVDSVMQEALLQGVENIFRAICNKEIWREKYFHVMSRYGMVAVWYLRKQLVSQEEENSQPVHVVVQDCLNAVEECQQFIRLFTDREGLVGARENPVNLEILCPIELVLKVYGAAQLTLCAFNKNALALRVAESVRCPLLKARLFGPQVSSGPIPNLPFVQCNGSRVVVCFSLVRHVLLDFHAITWVCKVNQESPDLHIVSTHISKLQGEQERRIADFGTVGTVVTNDGQTKDPFPYEIFESKVFSPDVWSAIQNLSNRSRVNLVIVPQSGLETVPYAALPSFRHGAQQGRTVLISVLLTLALLKEPEEGLDLSTGEICGYFNANNELQGVQREQHRIKLIWEPTMRYSEGRPLQEIVNEAVLMQISAHGLPLDGVLVVGTLLRNGARVDVPISTEQIMQTRFPKLRVVIISSCKSAAGTQTLAEGPLSIAYAFLYAGAKCVIASLSNVDDEAISHLTIRLHQDLSTSTLGDVTSLAQVFKNVRSTLYRNPTHPGAFRPSSRRSSSGRGLAGRIVRPGLQISPEDRVIVFGPAHTHVFAQQE